jgi:hypothetical protein
MFNTTMTAAPVAEMALPADVSHPAWCDRRLCYRQDTGYPMHSWEAPDELIGRVRVSFTIVRKDSVDGPGKTLVYIHSVSELEGERITSYVIDDSRETPRKRALVAEDAIAASSLV